jgi:peroxiredoxin
MIYTHRISLVLLAACLAPLSSVADKLGDPAAPLTIKQWIKGQPVDIKAGTNIYVVEFWAALSPNSRASIPKLNELQKQFKDKGVVVVGISDEPVDKIKEFVELRAQVEYVVAADDQRKTAQHYMVAYGQKGIPHAFIVGKDGKVLWHGHPLQGLDKALDEITSGHYDLARAIKLDATRAEVDDYRVLTLRGDPKAKELGQKLLAERTNNPVALCALAYRIVTDVRNTNRDFVLAGQALDRAQALAPTNTPQLLMARGFLLFEKGRKDEGVALARQAVDLTKDAKEKATSEVYLRSLEARMKPAKTNESRSPAGKP